MVTGMVKLRVLASACTPMPVTWPTGTPRKSTGEPMESPLTELSKYMMNLYFLVRNIPEPKAATASTARVRAPRTNRPIVLLLTLLLTRTLPFCCGPGVYSLPLVRKRLSRGSVVVSSRVVGLPLAVMVRVSTSR